MKPSRIWLQAETLSRISTQAIWTVLVTTGDPSANENRFDREIAHMRSTALSMIEMSSVNASQLADSLRRHCPSVLHVSAHASDDHLALHTDGRLSWVSFTVIADMLHRLPAPKLLVLNVCRSGSLAALLGTWALTTVYWAETIEDQAARAFSYPFYVALLAGESVGDAVAIARADAPQLLGRAPGINGALDLVLTPRSREGWRQSDPDAGGPI